MKTSTRAFGCRQKARAAAGADRGARRWRRHDDPPTALYVHVPFCERLCPYCDFAIAKYSAPAAARYLSALERELADIGTGIALETLFVGGGTPSRLAPPELERLFAMLSRTVRLADVRELTLECNPEGFTREKARRLCDAGVTRFSLGVQSFNAAHLKTLGRTHDPRTARAAIEAARTVGPAAAVNVDLIFAVPGQSLDDWQSDINAVLELAPDHISLYNLTYESGTPLTRRRDAGRLTPADEDTEAAMLQLAIEQLAAGGYEHYEISNFARPGHASQHNLTYWRGEPYYAAGLGATSYVAGVRAVRERRLPAYLRRLASGASAIVETIELDEAARRRERLAFALRMMEGVPIDAFKAATGTSPLEVGGEALLRFAEAGFVEISDTHVRLTPRGIMVADAIMRELI